jgi:hypothetical protein
MAQPSGADPRTHHHRHAAEQRRAIVVIRIGRKRLMQA